jgi:hypothetical protein
MRDKQIEEIVRAYEEARYKAIETLGSMNEGVGVWYATAFYKAGYRKASDVAREIFEEFRNAMRAEIARNEELFAEDEDDFYEGRNDAFRTAINCLAELKKKYTGEDTKVTTNTEGEE